MDRVSRRAAIAGTFGALAPAVIAGRVRAAAPLSLGGWREAILVVPALEPWIETLTTVGGWEKAATTLPDDSLNGLWRLPPGARVEQVLMRNRGEMTGMIRLVRVTGADQRRIRADDQAWETGGLAALDVRVVDMAETHAALIERGWRAPSAPVRYEAYAGIEVIQWTPVSPDGIRLSLIQRVSPPLVGWLMLRRWSRAINAAVITKDMGTATGFFGETLGFPVGGRSTAIGNAGPNVMGLPWRFLSQVSTSIVGFRPAGTDSAIELIAMPEARGRDHAAEAHPPNIGLAGLRFVVDDLVVVTAALAAHGVAFSPPRPVRMGPYGDARVIAATAPDGVWLEFAQLAA